MPVLRLDGETTLRPLADEDTAAVHRLMAANRAHLDRWLRWSSAVQSADDVRRMIAQFTEKLARGDGFHLGLWVGEQLAGGCICWSIHRQSRNAEVGYWLGAEFTGRGLATRAARAVVAHLFSGEKLHRLEMQCAVDNLPSRAVAERLGFRLEGVRRDSHWITDRFRDHAVYGLLESEWGDAGSP